MLTTNKTRVWSKLVNDNAVSVLTPERQTEILRAAKTVRNMDYVSRWVIPGTVANSTAQQITTRANWLFVLTDISIWEQEANDAGLPRFNLTFETLPENVIFKDRTPENIANTNTVPAHLCVGSQGLWRPTSFEKNYHFEEPKDTLIVCPQRSVIGVKIQPYTNMNGLTYNYRRGALLLSGLEIEIEGGDNG